MRAWRLLGPTSVLALALLGPGVEAASTETDSRASGAATERAPEQDFRLHCAGCHRLDGSGVPGEVPDLRALGAVLGSAAGRRYVARVPGVAQAPLDDEALARLLAWVARELAGVDGVAWSTAELGALRARPLRDPRAARDRILRAADTAE
ncbi:MAG: hypothetical protein H6748_13930 [Spirochaetaceae bacterium]|nr:hypothetical protein [Spirochaetaceae bacterium]HPG26605.1 hypothetical protein [Myxococcota bacterium]